LTNEFGEVVAWEQEVRGDMGTNTERFEPEEIATINVTKASGRDNIGISQALRAEEEIESYMQNSRAINNAVEIAAYPHHFWKVGTEGANVIDDDELRRFRNMVDDMEGDTQFVAGADVEHELIEASNFEFEKITEHDLRKLALALGVPLELANVGSDGLGSGMPAELRKTMFERQGRADQRKLTSEVTEQLLRPIIEEYSPFSAGEYDGLRLGDPISEHESSSLNEIAPYLTTNEVRSELDREPVEDEEIGESFREPREVEGPDEQPAEEGVGGGGGFFSDSRALQTRGNPISDPDECGGTVIEGPQGGLRCIPEGEGQDSESDADSTDVTKSDVEPPNETVPDQSEIPSDLVETEELGFEVPEDRLRGSDFLNVGLVAHSMDDEEASSVDPETLHFNEPNLDGENIKAILDARPEDLPPIEGYRTSDDRLVVTDGNHRAAAAKVQGWDALDMKVVDTDEFEEIDMRDGENANAREASRDLAGTPEWDEHYLDLYERIWDDGAELSEFFSSDTPEFVKQRLKDAIWSGSVFHDIESIPSGELMQLREFLTEELEDGNWNIDGIANRLQDLEGDLSQDRAELIARTETASTVNTAREIGYEERGQEDGLFYWVGGLDDRTTEACRWLINETNPNHGGDPVPLDELRELIEEAPTHDPEMQDDLARPEDYVVHPNERKTWVRHAE
jgi:hypothetical protein